MNDISRAFELAANLIWSWDKNLLEIVLLSLRISLTAVFIACSISLPLAALLVFTKFPGRKIIIITINVFMGLPPVVVGLFVYLMLSRAGPLGPMGLLFTPTAMIIAQVLLVTPVITAISRQIVENLHTEYQELFTSLGASPFRRMTAILWDGRFHLTTAGLAGFGRAISEVGAVMIVGGNIDHLTRVMTTAIALEARKGELAMAMALGIVLMSVALTVNLMAYFITEHGKEKQNS